MAEKRGDLEKLVYDFNTAGVLEIQMADEKWYRVIAPRFRSYDGPRRITEPQYTERANPYVPMRTYLYEGPLYLFKTNKKVKGSNSLQFIETLDSKK